MSQLIRHALPISAGMLALFGYWFGLADRYAVFLYEHLGATPFDTVTRSRYWMSGLVAAGIVLVGYTGFCWMMGRLTARRGGRYQPPAWPSLWLACAAPLAVGIPLITMTLNAPTLPAWLALCVALAALIGLGIALWPARLAAQQPARLFWAGLDGLTLVPAFLLIRALELPAQGLITRQASILIAACAVLAGLFGRTVLGLLRPRWGVPKAQAGEVLWAGAAISYLILPLVHLLCFTPVDYRYITTAANFFPSSPWLLALSGLAALGLALLPPLRLGQSA